MSLFTKLFYLNLNSVNKPLENFFTEIVVCFLQHNKAILMDWLKSHSIINEETYSRIEILSQQRYPSLPNQNEDSIIDIRIDLSNRIDTDLVFIESKIGAKDGNNNLKKYAEVLSSLENIRHRILIYITRDYDPKDEIQSYSSKLSPSVSFYQLRWYEFYHFLNEYNPDSLNSDILKIEILKFMKENRMFRNNQFSDIDLLTIVNFSRTIQLIDDTLNGKVKKTFIESFSVGKHKDPSISDWRKEDSYRIRKYLSRKEKYEWHFVCDIGYFINLNKNNLTGYPDIGVCWAVSVNYDDNGNNYRKCRESMNKIINENNDKPDKWILHSYDSDKWIAIFYTRNLQDFLSAQDHVSAIQQHFLDCIREIKDIQNNYFDFIKNEK